MKISNIFLVAAGMLPFILVSCNEKNELDYNIMTGNTLYAPENGAEIDLTTGVVTTFEWAPSVAEDNGYVGYEVLFDTPDGDFSNPVATYASALTGSQTNLSMSATDLNSVAGAAGIPVAGTGSFKWTVRASKGVGGSVYTQINELTVTRQNAMSPLPEAVTLGGAAVEDPENGIAMVPSPGIDKEAALEGTFECYTRLTDGEFTVTDDQGRFYTLNADGSVTNTGTAVSSTMPDGAGLYRLLIQFNGMVWTAQKISKVELQAASSDVLGGNGYEGNDWKMYFPVEYQGKGVWAIFDYENTQSLKKDGNGGYTAGDTRHRFNMTMEDGSVIYLGTESALGTEYSVDYMKVHLYTDATIGNADWDKTWNFLSGDCGRAFDGYLYMNGDNEAGTFYHEYIFK
ncbi:MAG: SusE domain-containing protein [Bacteroidetes bacterium]|uniref:SusE domain-containing protein n=1 Tax=Candidatus Cryptobacteroides avicola TaxID=2840757 RepID=A0A940DSG7_9BACT|nr:SusE domain-containing protein [Candidatus Cryptobacteroides avicola]